MSVLVRCIVCQERVVDPPTWNIADCALCGRPIGVCRAHEQEDPDEHRTISCWDDGRGHTIDGALPEHRKILRSIWTYRIMLDSLFESTVELRFEMQDHSVLLYEAPLFSRAIFAWIYLKLNPIGKPERPIHTNFIAACFQTKQPSFQESR